MRFAAPRRRCASSQCRQKIVYTHPASNDRGSTHSTTSSCGSSSTSSCVTSTARRKVRFQVTQFTYHEPPPSRNPPILKSKLYYTKGELEDIELENRAIIECIRERKTMDDISDLVRGLEDCTGLGARHRFWSHKNALDAVLHEQERQRNEGISEPEKTAEIYALFSVSCVREASVVGSKDAEIAKRALEHIGEYDHEDDPPMLSLRSSTSTRESKHQRERKYLAAQHAHTNKNKNLVGECMRRLFGLDHQ